MEDDVKQEAQGLSETERAAVAELVSQSMKSEMKNVSKETYTELVASHQADVGDELNPTWARHAGMFLNAFAKNADGDKATAMQLMKDFNEKRVGLNTNAKAHEEREALRIVKNSSISTAAKVRIQSTLSDSAGNYLLPKPFLAEMFVTLEEHGVARRTFRGVPMTSKNLDLKDVASKPAVVWEAENAKITETSIGFGEKQLVAKKLAALLPWTNEFDEDSAFNFITIASQLFGEAIALKEDQAGFLGGGSSDTANGGYIGMLNLVGAKVHNLGGFNGSGKTGYADVTFDDLNTAKNMLSLARKRNARWFVHHSIVGVLERITGTDGQYVYRQPQTPGQPGTIWGYPVEQVEAMPKLDDADQEGSRFIAFGDPSNMLFGTRRGVTFDVGREGTIIDTSTAENSYSAFQQDGAILRVTQRIGFQTPLDDNFVVLKTAAS